MRYLLFLSLLAVPAQSGASFAATCAEPGAPSCEAEDRFSDETEDESLLQTATKRPRGADVVLAEPDGTASSRRGFDLAGKSIYLIMTDRFNRVGGFNPGDEEPCSGNDHWCNGTLKGITARLPYIKGMGFDCIWVTPVVKNFDGYDGQSGYGYAGYWTENYYEIDPHFGTKADMKQLVWMTHASGMCFILDIVVNHVRPIHSTADVAMVYPFNKPCYLHQLGIGSMSFDDYAQKTSGWPPPTQALGPGAACLLTTYPNGTVDPTNGGNYCNNYNPAGGPYTATNYLPDAPGPAELKYCGPGNYVCKGYDENVNHLGWFYDLGDLNQTHPFVRQGLLDWASHMATEYDVDGFRLDTAPFVTWDFLHELQARLASLPKPVQIFGEVTSTNLTFHASFQRKDDMDILAGMQNFPLEYYAQAGYCGWPNSPSSPVAINNLTYLAEATTFQLTSDTYTNVDVLANFMDNQDDTPVAGQCSDASQLRNSLVWVMLAKGMPVITWGDEQGNTVYRNSLWQFGWKTTTWQYKFIRKLNFIRKVHRVGTARSKVVFSSSEQFVFARGGGLKCNAWVFTNNLPKSKQTIKYPVVPPPPPAGKFWRNALTGKRVKVCYITKAVTAPSTEPLVLVLSLR